MGILILLWFLGGLVVSVALLIIGVVFHRRSTAAKGQDRNWLRFISLTIGFTIAALFVVVLLFETGPGAPSGADYGRWVIGGGLAGASLGIGTLSAALISRKYPAT